MNNETQVEDPPQSTNDGPITGTTEEVFGEDQPVKETVTKETTDDGKGAGAAKAPPSAEDIAAAVQRGTEAAAARVKPAEPERQYSQQELDQIFKVWNPTEELITKLLGGGEEAVKAMVEIRQGLLAQFDTLTNYRLELLEKKIAGQMQPALTYAQEAAAAKDREEFFGEHEDLKEWEPLVQTVFNALKAEGFVAKDKAEAYKTLADRTRELLPKGNGAGSGAGQSSGARTTTTTQPAKRPAALSSGSQAGGGGGSSAPATGFSGGEVFL